MYNLRNVDRTDFSQGSFMETLIKFGYELFLVVKSSSNMESKLGYDWHPEVFQVDDICCCSICDHFRPLQSVPK